MKILTHWLRTFVPNIPVDDLQLAEDLTLRGIAVEGVHNLGLSADGQPNGHLFEMDITTNRVDAMNHYGIAREAATIYNLPLLPLLPARQDAVILGEAKNNRIAPGGAQTLPIAIAPEAAYLCGRFTARILRNITVGPAQDPIAGYFTLLAQKQISAPVDASNYMLLAMGQPTHAFDLDKIHGGIIVRLARPGETLTLLDGTTRTLHSDDLVIADHTRALSLAGVMGGLDSSITASTRNVLIESAWFDPAAIRASSRRHIIHTDASHRFERGADFAAAPIANNLVTNLIISQCGGQADPELVDIVQPHSAALTTERPPIPLSVKEVHRHLGTTIEAAGIPASLIHQYLTALGCTLTESAATPEESVKGVILSGSEGTEGTLSPPDSPTLHNARPSPEIAEGTLPDALTSILSTGEGSLGPRNLPKHTSASIPRPSPVASSIFQVKLPSWRLDLTREIDLIEEIARVYGYNRFANTLPPFTGSVHPYPTARAEQAIHTRLLALGYSEAISSTFASAADSALFATTPAIRLENPLSDEAGFLRPSLIPGMLTMLGHNLNRDVLTVRLFESGHIFTGSPAAVHEPLSLTLGITGSIPSTALHTATDAPFYHLKATLESVASLFETSSALAFSSTDLPSWLEPTRAATATLAGQPVAAFGQLSVAEAARRKLRQAAYLAEVDLDYLLTLPLRRPVACELSRFQAVERDFSFTFPDTTKWQEIAAAILALTIPELQRLTPVEIFRDAKGKTVPPAHYSVLLRTLFQSAERTLLDEDLSRWSVAIVTTLQDLGGTLRA